MCISLFVKKRMSLHIELGFNGFTQLIAFVYHVILLYYICEACAFILSFIRNLWIRYNITMDIIVVSLIGAYLYFIMHLYLGYVSTIMLILASLLYFSGNYIPYILSGNFIIIFLICFFFFEHTEQILIRFYIFLYSIIRYIYILGIVLVAFLSKIFF